MPDFLAPMLAKSGTMPDDYERYGFEIKWDGIRAVAYVNGGKTILASRNLLDISAQYPELAALSGFAGGKKLILDGEIVALAEDGRPSFSRLQHRMGISPARLPQLMSKITVTYMIFDLLELGGKSLTGAVYTERRKMLEDLQLSGPYWQTPSFRRGEGPQMQIASKVIGLEGIVAKRLDSLYEIGKRSGAWVKIKNQKRQELVIGGWVEGQGRRKGRIGALLVGYYDQPLKKASPKNKLSYAGKVGSGFSDQVLHELAEKMRPLKMAESPFFGVVPASDAVFIKPVLVGEFEFTEWTPGNTLRHPSFKGLRSDKSAGEVVRE